MCSCVCVSPSEESIFKYVSCLEINCRVLFICLHVRRLLLLVLFVEVVSQALGDGGLNVRTGWQQLWCRRWRRTGGSGQRWRGTSRSGWTPSTGPPTSPTWPPTPLPSAPGPACCSAPSCNCHQTATPMCLPLPPHPLSPSGSCSDMNYSVTFAENNIRII